MKKVKKYLLLVFSIAFVSFHCETVMAAYSLPTNTGLPTSSSGIKGILANLLSWLLSIFGIIAIIGFVVSGIQYFLATGDEKMMQTAKRNALYSILGVIVALSAYVVIKAIDTALRGSSGF
ncbi:MAG: hypothetical protein WCV59_01260 [Parcubacteria group bacterium]